MCPPGATAVLLMTRHSANKNENDVFSKSERIDTEHVLVKRGSGDCPLPPTAKMMDKLVSEVLNK